MLKRGVIIRVVLLFILLWLAGCEMIQDIQKEEVSKPVIYNIKAGSSDKIGEIYISFTADTFEGSVVYVTVKGNGKVFYEGSLRGADNGYGGTNINFKVTFDTRVIDSNVFPYHVDIIVSSREDYSVETSYSTDLTFPMDLFGVKVPKGVNKAAEILNDFVASETTPFYDYSAYYVDYNGEKFRISGLELTSSTFEIFSDDMHGGELVLKASYDKPISADATLIDYTIENYSPPASYPDMKLKEYLKIIGISYDTISSDVVVAERPRLFMKIATDKNNENYHPVSHRVYYLIDLDNYIGVGYDDRYFDETTLSKVPLKRFEYFINGNDAFLMGRETGNMLAVSVEAQDSLFSKMKVELFSPTFFIGPVPGSEFYSEPDAVLIEGDWNHPIYNLSQIPDEYREFVIKAINELKATLDSLEDASH